VRSWGPATGVIVASLAFAALHLAGGARSPLTLLNLFFGGLLFGLLALRTGGIAAPAGAHALWNWAEQILLGLDPNPGTGSFGALFDLDLVGTAAWGGSEEGLNASLALTFVLVALIVPLLFWRRGRAEGATVPAPPG
jgi:membrane protease YdiL (CAAX protease family)